MFNSSFRISLILLVLLAAVAAYSAGSGSSAAFPNPAVDAQKAKTSSQQTAVVAGGCFWGIQAVFQHVKGVINATSGYAGGSSNTAEYETVSSGETVDHRR